MAATITNASVNGTTITVSGTGGVVGGKVGVYLDGSLQSPRATPDGSGNWTLNLLNVSAGQHQVRAADIIMTNFSVTTQFVPAQVSIGSSVGPVTEDVTPVLIGTLTNNNGAPVDLKNGTVYYKRQADSTYLVAGSVVTDSGGAFSFEFASPLTDGPYDFYVEFTTVVIRSAVSSVTVSKPNEAPIMPANSVDWLDSFGEPNRPEGKYGYLASMIVGIGAPNGYEVGCVLSTNIAKPAPTYSIAAASGSPGDAAGFSIDANTGMITVSDTTQITISGFRSVTITATNSVGSSSYTGPIQIVSASQNLRFVSTSGDDANAGNLPHLPKLTLASTNQYIRRGDEFVGPSGLPLANGSKHRSYGDPELPNPVVQNTAGPGAYHSNSTGERSNLLIQDIDFKGTEDCVFLSNGTGNRIYRVAALGNTVNNNNAQGFQLGGQTNLKMFHFSTETVFGDGMLMTRPNNVELGHFDFSVPVGGAADCCQITFLGKTNFVGNDVYIHDGIMRQQSAGSSLKGSLVIEGIGRTLVERCTILGKYFCFSNQGNNSTCRDSYLFGAKFPAGNTSAFGIGCGGERGLPDPNDASVGHDQQVYHNVIEDCYSAIASAGFSDGDTLQRPDFEYQFNDIRKATIGVRIVRATSGNLNYNLMTGVATAVVRNGKGTTVAVGGDFNTQSTTPQYTQIAGVAPLCTVLPTATGTVQEGQTLTYSTGTWSGSPTAFEYVTFLNGREIYRSTTNTYQVGAGLSAQINTFLPISLQKAELSYLVYATDANGRKGQAVGRFPALSNVTTQNVKYAPILA